MDAYRTVWVLACAALAVPGLAVASTWPTSSVLALALACAFLAGVTSIHFTLFTTDGQQAPAPCAVLARAARNAAAWTVGMVAFIGLAGVAGRWALLGSLLLAGTSPPALRVYERWWRSAEGVTDDDDDVAGPAELESTGDGHLPRARDVPVLSDAELCQAWERSFHALRAAHSPMAQARIVERRHAYLDELSRRSPSGFKPSWSFGSSALEDASGLLAPGARADEPSIDWDRLVFGQDNA